MSLLPGSPSSSMAQIDQGGANCKIDFHWIQIAMTYQLITPETDLMTITLNGYRMSVFVKGWQTTIDL